jgi:hypothetical protein
MISRIALALSFAAMAATVAGLILLGNKLSGLSRRIAELEGREAPAKPPPSMPRDPAPERKESLEESNRRKIRELSDKENQDHLDALMEKLDVETALVEKIRQAFAEEFAYYTDGVVRALDSLKADPAKGDDAGLESPAFRKGLEERILATDARVRPLLDPARTAKYDEWRQDLRKNRYDLD